VSVWISDHDGDTGIWMVSLLQVVKRIEEKKTSVGNFKTLLQEASKTLKIVYSESMARVCIKLPESRDF